MAYKLIDLFSGAGGMTLGFSDERFGGGFSCVLSIDNDKAASNTHCLNYQSPTVSADIEAWLDAGNEIPSADVVIGGPPCQGFSLLNKNRKNDARRALWQPYMDVVQRSGARLFVMENVPELFRSDEFTDIVARANAMGFCVAAEVLVAANYGAPQVRRRTVIVGWKESTVLGGISFPPPKTHSPPGVGDGLPDWRTVRDAIGDLPPPKGTEIRHVAPPLDLHFGRNPTEMSMARYRAVPPGGNRFDLQKNAPHLTPDCWIRKTSGGTDLFGRLWWDRPSVTIRTEFFKPEKGRYLHPEQHRPITHREAARLMGFPDDFRFHGSKTEIARQIGNAIPPPLAGALAKMIKAALDASDVNRQERMVA